MKKVKFDKLQLNKFVVANLNITNHILGGSGNTQCPTDVLCPTGNPTCPNFTIDPTCDTNTDKHGQGSTLICTNN